jgi:ElaB/YqjD/DUF883 family membrane-anchored ribosome-binding protein
LLLVLLEREEQTMEQTSAAVSGGQTGGLDSAKNHLKSTWEQGKEAAQNVRRTATESWNDLSREVDSYVRSRPGTVALGALGAGLVLGFLTGTLVSRSRRSSS